MKVISFIVIVFAIIGLSSSFEWTKDTIPNPISSPPPFCNLEENGHPLCDPDLQLDRKQQLNYIFEKQSYISRLGECPCAGTCNNGENNVIGFLFLKKYQGIVPNEVNPKSLQELTDYVRGKWKLGTCDNSILITIATEPKQYAISIGERATQIINETWSIGILEENFRQRATFNLFHKVKDILYMYEQAIEEELKARDILSSGPQSSSTDSNNNTILYTILLLCILLVIITVVSIILFVVLRHRKENDDVSLRDVWSKKFWTKAGKQYKEAKQSEINGNDKDIEKNEDEEVKAKLASTEDLKPVDDIDNENSGVEYPGKFSKI